MVYEILNIKCNVMFFGAELTPLHADNPDSIFEPLRFKMLDG